MNTGSTVTVGVFVTAVATALALILPQPGTVAPGTSGPISSAIAALPPTGAGLPNPPMPASTGAAHHDTYLGGSKATGRVAEVYVKVAENVFVAADRVPEHLRKDAERWVDVQFPELLGGDVESARAVLRQSEPGVQVGDVVEIKFAHKDNPRFFPVRETTRVTALVAKKDEMLAKEYEQRILARSGHGTSTPLWLTQARMSVPKPGTVPPPSMAEAGH